MLVVFAAWGTVPAVPEGVGCRTGNLGLICFLEDYSELFFSVFKQIGISANDYLKNWDTERLLLLGWCFSRSSFSLQVFKRGFMRHFLKGFWLCRCLGRSPGFIEQIIYFFDNPLFKCHENVLHRSTFGNLWGFLFHLSKKNLIVKLHLTKV